MAITRTATARYDGAGKDGKGTLTTQSGVLKDQRYGFHSRFEDGPGTNPEELIAAAHAGCFTMALSLALAKEGVSDARLETTARVRIEPDGDGFTVTRSDLELTADVPGLDESRLREVAEGAKRNCPISKLLKADMELTVRIGMGAEA
jgi:osmotically inducible protein OsmC